MVTAALVAVLLASFFIVEALELPLLTQPEGWLGEATVGTAALGVALLIADVLIPVPSTVVMPALGHLYGVAGGTALNFAGAFLASVVGFALGRQGGKWVERVVAHGEWARANARLERWGALAIVITRPVPLLAETMVIVAGGSNLSWPRLLIAAAIGSLPVAVVWAIVGASVAH